MYAYLRALGVLVLIPMLFAVVGPVGFQEQARWVATGLAGLFFVWRYLRGVQLAVRTFKVSGLGYVAFVLIFEALPMYLLVRYMFYGWPRA
jgi:hypothetical protein